MADVSVKSYKRKSKNKTVTVKAYRRGMHPNTRAALAKHHFKKSVPVVDGARKVDDDGFELVKNRQKELMNKTRKSVAVDIDTPKPEKKLSASEFNKKQTEHGKKMNAQARATASIPSTNSKKSSFKKPVAPTKKPSTDNKPKEAPKWKPTTSWGTKLRRVEHKFESKKRKASRMGAARRAYKILKGITSVGNGPVTR